jgi:hypothetical protein
MRNSAELKWRLPVAWNHSPAPKLQLQTQQVTHMEWQQTAGHSGDVEQSNWAQWQSAVLALLRADVTGVLRSLQIDEVDWDIWRNFYTEGRSPRSAIDRALARDF